MRIFIRIIAVVAGLILIVGSFFYFERPIPAESQTLFFLVNAFGFLFILIGFLAPEKQEFEYYTLRQIIKETLAEPKRSERRQDEYSGYTPPNPPPLYRERNSMMQDGPVRDYDPYEMQRRMENSDRAYWKRPNDDSRSLPPNSDRWNN